MSEGICKSRGHIVSPVSPRCIDCGTFSSDMMLVTRTEYEQLTQKLAAAEDRVKEALDMNALLVNSLATSGERFAESEARLAAVATDEWDRITNERDEALRKLAETKELLGQGHTQLDAAERMVAGLTERLAAANAENERLKKLLEPCRPDTDAQTDSGYPRTVDDVLSLLSAYVADFLPDDMCPDDEYFGAWERQARKVVSPMMERLTAAEAELQTWKDKCSDVAAELAVMRLKHEGGCL